MKKVESNEVTKSRPDQVWTTTDPDGTIVTVRLQFFSNGGLIMTTHNLYPLEQLAIKYDEATTKSEKMQIRKEYEALAKELNKVNDVWNTLLLPYASRKKK